jgi:hypothetical protein
MYILSSQAKYTLYNILNNLVQGTKFHGKEFST